MSFSVIQGTLASTVTASGGTFTASYPSGKDAGSFFLAMSHKLSIDGNMLFFPVDFNVTLGTTTITITNNTAGAWAQGSAFKLQMEEQGDRAQMSVPLQNPNAMTGTIAGTVYNVDARSKLVASTTEAYADLITLGAPIALSANSICLSQSIATSGNLSIGGALASGGVATLDVPRNITAVLTGAGTQVITVTGTDVYGYAMSEAITLAGTSTVSGNKAFKTVTQVSASAAIDNPITVGHGDKLGLPIFLPSAANIVSELRSGAVVGGGRTVLGFQISQADLLAPVAQQLYSPVNGVITKLNAICQLTIVTGGNITVNVGTTPVDGLTIAFSDGSVPGAVRQDAPTQGHSTTVVSAGSRIQIVPDASFATSGSVNGSLEIAGTAGTVVAGIRTSGGSTTTTGDVRGTYTPPAACDGTSVIQLLAILPDRYVGVRQNLS